MTNREALDWVLELAKAHPTRELQDYEKEAISQMEDYRNDIMEDE